VFQSATLTIIALPDTIRENTETVMLILQSDPTYSLQTTTPQIVNIIDNNSGGLPGVGFDLAASSGLESVRFPLVFRIAQRQEHFYRNSKLRGHRWNWHRRWSGLYIGERPAYFFSGRYQHLPVSHSGE